MARPGPAPRTARAAIVGLAGLNLEPDEARLFRRTPPAGVILFARNVAEPAQLAALTAALRNALGPEAALLIDQEGGRVARLRPPHWPEFPPAAAFAGLPEAAARANAALIGLTCRAAGFDTVCAPVLDLRLPDAHEVIGDRAFAADPAEVARLGRAWVQGLQDAGCVPVLKHIPGHGRATADSHLELPRVVASRQDLAQDCGPFAALAGLGAWAMTAHILYDAFDPRRPATLSPLVINRVIRRAIGFDGLLVTDDLAMRALRGDPGALAQHAIAAGCDLVLHCTGVLEDTAALLEDCPSLAPLAARRMADARARAVPRPLDAEALREIRDSVLSRIAA